MTDTIVGDDQGDVDECSLLDALSADSQDQTFPPPTASPDQLPSDHMKSEKLCAVARCHAHVAGSEHRLCVACLSRMDAELACVPVFFNACANRLVNVSARPMDHRRSRNRGSVIHDQSVIDLCQQVLAFAASWAGLIADQCESGERPPREVGSLFNFLRGHLSWLARHDAASDFAEELSEVCKNAERVAVPRGDVRKKQIGRCVEPGCDGTVYATLGAEGVAPVDIVHCSLGHRWPPKDWLRLKCKLDEHQAVNDDLEKLSPSAPSRQSSNRRRVPAKLAALAAGVSVRTVYRWVDEGKLTRFRANGRTTYSLEEIYRVSARQTLQR